MLGERALAWSFGACVPRDGLRMAPPRACGVYLVGSGRPEGAEVRHFQRPLSRLPAAPLFIAT
jgi:hypothetical protein